MVWDILCWECVWLGVVRVSVGCWLVSVLVYVDGLLRRCLIVLVGGFYYMILLPLLCGLFDYDLVALCAAECLFVACSFAWGW